MQKLFHNLSCHRKKNDHGRKVDGPPTNEALVYKKRLIPMHTKHSVILPTDMISDFKKAKSVSTNKLVDFKIKKQAPQPEVVELEESEDEIT